MNPQRTIFGTAAGVWLGVLALLGAGCARDPAQTDQLFTSTGFAHMAEDLPSAAARRLALDAAEISARDQLKTQISHYEIDAASSIGSLAVVDPFVRAVLDDSVRAAQVIDRTINQDGVATVTVQTRIGPLLRMVEIPPRPPLD